MCKLTFLNVSLSKKNKSVLGEVLRNTIQDNELESECELELEFSMSEGHSNSNFDPA